MRRLLRCAPRHRSTNYDRSHWPTEAPRIHPHFAPTRSARDLFRGSLTLPSGARDLKAPSLDGRCGPLPTGDDHRILTVVQAKPEVLRTELVAPISRSHACRLRSSYQARRTAVEEIGTLISVSLKEGRPNRIGSISADRECHSAANPASPRHPPASRDVTLRSSGPIAASERTANHRIPIAVSPARTAPGHATVSSLDVWPKPAHAAAPRPRTPALAGRHQTTLDVSRQRSVE